MVGVCVFAGFAVLVARLIHLQAVQHQLAHTSVQRQSDFTEVVPARPGEILDRNGHVLAMTVTRDSLYAVPSEITDAWSFAWSIASVLDVDADQLYRRLTENKDRQFIWVRRRITDEQVGAVRNLQLAASTWGLRKEYLRQYPQGMTAAHIIGMRDIDNQGHGGLEQSMDDLIRGVDGTRVITRDARGVVVEVEAARSRVPEHGRTVVSTIDLLTQIEVERQLDELVEEWRPVGACAVVMDPHSGEILAMTSRPSFDPNRPAEVPNDAWRNLAVSAVFEPGSTYKPFVVAWAIQQGLLRKEEVIPCFNGAYRMGRRVLHDHHAYPELSVEDILIKSSNIGMARIGERLGLDGLYRATVAFGFGRRTGIELPGEVPGLVRSYQDWDEYSIGSIPMGQELAVTPLQLITAHSALANGGQLVRPLLLLDTNSDQATPSPLSTVRTVDPSAPVESTIVKRYIADWVVRFPMKGVVDSGTGKSARVPGLSIFGKTGTAQKVDPEGGYSNSRHVCSFICGAPAENPRVLVLVMVDEPTASGSHYGGTVAAPAASRILQYAVQRMPQLNNRYTVTPEHDLPITRAAVRDVH
jgi:cell division protein FtsI/penicillin-binding protein 2